MWKALMVLSAQPTDMLAHGGAIIRVCYMVAAGHLQFDADTQKVSKYQKVKDYVTDHFYVTCR